MPRAYAEDLRGRVIEAVQGGASRREAAERFEISPSSAVKWVQHWEETGSAGPKPTGGSISPLEEHADSVLELVEEQPDLTLVEIVAALRKRRIVTSRSSVWRFFERHKLTFKKKPAGRRARSGRCCPGASIVVEEAAASRCDLSSVY
jgi:transposase